MALKNVTVRKPRNVSAGIGSPTGVASTSSIGTLTAIAIAVNSVIGVAATTASGIAATTTTGSNSYTPTGVAATTAIGTVVPNSSILRTPTGVTATTASGTVVTTGLAQRTPTGVATTGSAGTSLVQTSGTGLVANLSASRTSGTAPFAVHFDATGTTSNGVTISSNPSAIFRDIGYYFDYGDTGAGNWAYSKDGTNVSKNYDRGAPIGSHVFETPGTYTVKVRARNSTGNVSDAQVTITVADPDVTYSGTNTICLSRTTDHTGAPAGATLLSNVSSWPAWASNKRYLLHAGQSFTTLGRPNLAGATTTLTNVSIGKYSSGASPIIAGLNIDGEPPGGSRTTWSSDIRIADLNLNANTIFSTQSHTDVLFLRCTNISGGGSIALELGGAIPWYANSSQSGPTTAANIYWPIRTFIIDCSINNGEYGITSWGRGTTIMGTLIPTSTQHNIRLWNAYKAVIRHNRLYGAGSGQHNIKLHATAYSAWNDLVNASSNESAFNVIAENNIGNASQGNPWSVAVGPQNDLAYEGVRDSIVEDNYFSYNYSLEVILGGLRLTSRGNAGVGAMNEGTGLHSGGIPPGWDTGYSTGGASITTSAPA